MWCHGVTGRSACCHHRTSGTADCGEHRQQIGGSPGRVGFVGRLSYSFRGRPRPLAGVETRRCLLFVGGVVPVDVGADCSGPHNRWRACRGNCAQRRCHRALGTVPHRGGADGSPRRAGRADSRRGSVCAVASDLRGDGRRLGVVSRAAWRISACVRQRGNPSGRRGRHHARVRRRSRFRSPPRRPRTRRTRARRPWAGRQRR